MKIERQDFCTERALLKMNDKVKAKGSRLQAFLLMEFSFFVYSFSGFFSKKASGCRPMSLPFIMYYGGMIMILGIYALLWQQVIKRLPVTLAYVNKTITIIWGIVIGRIFFGEWITRRQGIACLIIISGTILYVLQDQKDNKKDIEA